MQSTGDRGGVQPYEWRSGQMISRVILITGANGGLGRAMAATFLAEAESNFIWLGVRSRRDEALKLVDKFPGRCGCVDLDVTQPESWRMAIKKIQSEHARLDVLVNNAGEHHDGLLANLKWEDWQKVMATNLDGSFHGCQAVLPLMIGQRHGRIINIASLSALLAPAGQTNYAAAKAGVVALTQSLAKEVARIGITANAICPGYIETEAVASMTEEERRLAAARIPMRRFGRPEEIAAAVRFLACAEASYVTGSILKVDGGII
jgi:3-oxoacyl-[acyl-carrier protein] reductase